ncbi:acyl-CoA dehydrogenase family protein [Spirillospora sp. NPDC052242]
MNTDLSEEAAEYGRQATRAFEAAGGDALVRDAERDLSDAEVERSGVEALAKYALWSVQAGLPEAPADVLALRLAALEAADAVFRTAHLLHGAVGFCDESPLSWLSRYSRPIRRLPLGLSATRDRLTREIGRRGLTGLFPGGDR